jgi:hypothetical protein
MLCLRLLSELCTGLSEAVLGLAGRGCLRGRPRPCFGMATCVAILVGVGVDADFEMDAGIGVDATGSAVADTLCERMISFLMRLNAAEGWS